MSILAIGGAGFIGRRLIPLLVEENQTVTCMDIDVAGAKAAFGRFGDKVKIVRGDVTAFDDVIGAMIEAEAERVVNLSYFIGELAPHIAFKLDIQGMDNCFEAARRAGVAHTVFASSVAVSGEQARFGERMVNEDDERYGTSQYAVNKIINEWQAHDYRRVYDMTITCIRPANVTGPDKKFGSIDHVNCMCQPARGNPVSFPHRDTMRCVIHVEDMAAVFARVLLADRPERETYNSGGRRRQSRRTRRVGGGIPARRRYPLRERGGRPRDLWKLPDRQWPAGGGVRRAVRAAAPACEGSDQRHPARGGAAARRVGRDRPSQPIRARIGHLRPAPPRLSAPALRPSSPFGNTP